VPIGGADLTRCRANEPFSAAASSRLDVTTASEDLAPMVDDARGVAERAIDLHEDRIQIPAPRQPVLPNADAEVPGPVNGELNFLWVEPANLQQLIQLCDWGHRQP
jgi:hypothetical protein